MESRIFELGLTVEGTSLYLLLDAIKNGDGEAVLEDIRARWQSTEEKLKMSISELLAHKVIVEVEDGVRLYPVEEWITSSRS
ncbi:MAG: hypothetical protein ACQES5_02385 [Thermodesulfobacteriota bacterium]